MNKAIFIFTLLCLKQAGAEGTEGRGLMIADDVQRVDLEMDYFFSIRTCAMHVSAYHRDLHVDVDNKDAISTLMSRMHSIAVLNSIDRTDLVQCRWQKIL
jgi:hypothetical protein